MDLQQRLIAALLCANRNEQNRFYEQGIPQGLFTEHPREAKWIYDFRLEHGQFPSRFLFNQKFSAKISKVRDSVGAVLDQVLEASMFDQLVQVNNRVKTLIDAGEPIHDVVNAFKEGASSVIDHKSVYTDIDFATNKSALKRYSLLVDELNSPNPRLIDTPWPSINKVIHYFSPGNLVCIVSRMSVGKTWFLIAWAEYLAVRGFDVSVISKEMSADEVHDRLECLRYGLPWDAFRAGELPPILLRKWRKDRRVKSKANIVISGDETIDGSGIEQVVSQIQRCKPQVVFVDGAYLLKVRGLSKNASTPDKFAELSSSFKRIAKALNLIIVVVLQFNREAEQVSGVSKGGLSNVFGSDSWAQNADCVLSLNGQRGGATRELTIDKGRNSAIAACTIDFSLSPPRFPERASTVQQKLKQTAGQVTFKAVI